MNIIDRILSWSGNLILNRRLKKSNRNKQTYNLSSAHTIDILFDATSTSDFKIVKVFVDKLIENNKQVKVLGYVNNKMIPQQLYLINHFNFFCKKDKNIVKIPKSDIALEFINSQSDILLDLSLTNFFCLKYIASLKNSSFKIGKFITEKSHLDMMIDINKEESMLYLIEQIVHYLNLIKPKEIIEYE